MFPIDAITLDYLRFTGRPDHQVALVEAYAREQGLFHEADSEEAVYTDTLELDLGDVEPSLAGPRRPQDRVPLRDAQDSFARELEQLTGRRPQDSAVDQDIIRFAGEGGHVAVGVQEQVPDTAVEVEVDGAQCYLDHGSVVIAAITSCTNTSNPVVMVGAGLLARKAVERGLGRRPWVKTSLAPGSKVVTDYLDRSGLTEDLEKLGFNLVGYGCTTCIGNSGPAAGADLTCDRGGRSGGRVGPVRQPQLRGPHPLRGEDELPRLPAAGGRLRARRKHEHRPRQRPARRWGPTASPSTCATSGHRSRRSSR